MVRLSISSKGAKIKVDEGGNFVKDDKIPEGMIPIGDSGFYRSPDVVKPDNCRYYPSNPVCGGNPLSKDPIGLSIEPSVDSVGRISVSISPTLLFLKLPMTVLMYAPPGTRGEITPNISKTPSGTQERLGSDDYGHMNSNKNYILALDDDQNRTLRLGCGEVNVGIAVVSQFNGRFGNVIVNEYPRETIFVNGIPISEVWRCKVYNRVPESREAKDVIELGELRTSSPNQRPFLISGKGSVIKRYLSGDCGIYTEEDTDFEPGFVNFPPFWGRDEANAVFISKTREIDSCREVKDRDSIPPYYPEENCCMSCCQPSPNEGVLDQAEINEILRLLRKIDKNQGEYPATVQTWDSDPNKPDNQLKSITINSTRESVVKVFEEFSKVLRSIGIEEFPVSYPDTIIEPINEGVFAQAWDFFTPDKVRKITSLAGLLDWQNDQTSATLGHWQRKIEQVKDIQVKQPDGTFKTKTEKKTVVLPDIATVMEELFKMQVQIIKALGVTTDISLKTLQETADDTLMVAEILTRLKEIEQYLDFESTEKSRSVPMGVTIPPSNADAKTKQDLYAYLQPSKQDFRYDDWDGKNSLNDKLDKLLQMLGEVRSGTFTPHNLDG